MSAETKKKSTRQVDAEERYKSKKPCKTELYTTRQHVVKQALYNTVLEAFRRAVSK